MPLASEASDVGDVYYGRGVQVYFDGQWQRAEAYFDRATQYSPGDPRPYYFRGLARSQQGETFQAESDIRQGAIIEAGKGFVFPLGSALGAVTGEQRELLDRIRVEMLANLPAYQDGEG
ncbi:MAG: tetratricopeptide repeat protein, partial [Planctomycetota bacterium]